MDFRVHRSLEDQAMGVNADYIARMKMQFSLMLIRMAMLICMQSVVVTFSKKMIRFCKTDFI